MTPALPRIIRAAVIGGALVPALVAAQDERITLRFAPKPEQVLHTKSTMQMSMPPDAAGSGPAIESTVKSAYTLAFGKQDEQGRYDAEMVVDEMNTATTMNGQPVPAPNVQVPIVGKRFGVTYDANGVIVSMRVPDDAPGMEPFIKEMLGGINRALPLGETIGVGETIERPFEIPLPMPPGAPPASMHMTMKMTLKGVALDGPDRIATFDTVMTASMAGGDPRVAMTMSGTGTLEWDVDGEFARLTTADYTMTRPAGLPGPTAINMKMTMTTTK